MQQHDVDQPSMWGGDEVAEHIDPKALARRDDPVTSKKAASNVAKFSGKHQEMILQAMKDRGVAMGAEQISAALLRGGVKIDAYQVRKRLPEMKDKGLVKLASGADDGDHLRRTSSGQAERLWEVVSGT